MYKVGQWVIVLTTHEWANENEIGQVVEHPAGEKPHKRWIPVHFTNQTRSDNFLWIKSKYLTPITKEVKDIVL